MTRKSLYLVDVSSMIFRAFYAIRPLSSPSGLPVNAIYGFLTMTLKLLREIRPDYIAFCFDRPEPSFRKGIDARYKANRVEMPEDLVPQMPWFRKLSEALGVKCFDRVGFEADDIIGTLTKHAVQEGLEVIIVSGDKDFAQLIEENVAIYDTMKDVRYDRAAAMEKWGVEPSQMIDYLALIGDSSDNVMGVKGIGPKGAQKLLAEYQSLEEIYKNLANVKPDGARKKLEVGRDEAFLAKKLVTIDLNVPLEIELSEMNMSPIKREAVKPLFEELGFKSLIKQLFGEDIHTSGEVSSKAEKLAVNSVETSPLQPGPYWPDESIAVSDLARRFENLGTDKEVWVVQSERGLFLGLNGTAYTIHGDMRSLGQLLEGKLLLGFDLKDVAHQCLLKNFSVGWDSRLAAYVDHAGAIDSIHDLFKKYLGIGLPDFASGSQWLAWSFALRRALEKRLTSWNGLKILKELDQPLVPILYQMEKRGVLIDSDALQIQSQELGREIRELEARIFQEAGEAFNIGSPKQLSQILFNKIGLPPGKKTKTGYSTDNEVLEGIDHPIAQIVLNWRELSKLKSTYVDTLPKLADENGRVHTTFNQALTTTGRLSSVNPNLQNIPVRTERGAQVRKAFIAPEGRQLISIDYSQIELRILAEITGDAGLRRAFSQNLDIHAATAAEIFDVALVEVTSDMRRQAKAVNFGLAYGQGAFGLAETLGVSRGEAQKIIDRYFFKFSGVKDYMTEIVETAKKQGYVETLLGRRRYFPEFESKNAAIRKFGERAAINAPIQGTASDLVKKAMIEVTKLIQNKSSIDLLLQIHDELIFEADKTIADSDIQQILTAMQEISNFEVPLLANMGKGHSWQEAH